MTKLQSRGTVVPSGGAGKLVTAGSPLSGCCVLTDIVQRSGVIAIPVISSPVTPVNRRRSYPVVGSLAGLVVMTHLLDFRLAIGVAAKLMGIYFSAVKLRLSLDEDSTRIRLNGIQANVSSLMSAVARWSSARCREASCFANAVCSNCSASPCETSSSVEPR